LEVYPLKLTVDEGSFAPKINKLLKRRPGGLFADGKSPANIQLEPSVTLKAADLDAWRKL